MSTVELTEEEQAWEDNAQSLILNPIVRALYSDFVDLEQGVFEPEDGLNTREDVVARWVWYLENGEQEVSWHTPILVQANEFLKWLAMTLGVEYRPGMTEPVA